MSDPLLRQIKQIKVLELVLTVELAFGSCLTEATSMKSKDILIQGKETFIRLKKQNKSTGQRAKTLGVAKAITCYIKNDLEGHGRNLKWMTAESFH